MAAFLIRFGVMIDEDITPLEAAHRGLEIANTPQGSCWQITNLDESTSFVVDIRTEEVLYPK
jgi:hypothetical protein